MIHLQYDHALDDERDFMVTLTHPWFEPGDVDSDPFLREDVTFRAMRSIPLPPELEGLDARMQLLRIDVNEGDLTKTINWDAVEHLCMGDQTRKNRLVRHLEDVFDDVCQSVHTFDIRGGRA